MRYPDYLVHFNKNHSPKTGQFTEGDGDADGVTDDRHKYSENKKKFSLKDKGIPGLNDDEVFPRVTGRDIIGGQISSHLMSTFLSSDTFKNASTTGKFVSGNLMAKLLRTIF